MFYLLSFFYGAAIGSFVQVVATRLNVAPIVKSKSKCLSCGETLRVSDLVPVFSYLYLKGRCRYCRVPFGKEALAVELGFGAIFVLLYHFILAGFPIVVGSVWLLYYTLIFISLGVIALYDLRHSYVPVSFLSLFSFLAFSMLAYRFVYDHSSTVLLGPIVVALPFLLIWAFTQGKALGFGDVLLFLAVGAFFGIEQGLAVLLFSVWLGALIGSCIYVLRRRKKNTSTSIPFVPFIVLAFIIVLFTDLNIFSVAALFS